MSFRANKVKNSLGVISAAVLMTCGAFFSASVLAAVPVGATKTAAVSDVVVGLPDFTQLVTDVGPSVVNIRTMEKVRLRNPNFGNNDLSDLFRQFGFPFPNMPNPGGRNNRPDDQEQKMPEREVPRGVGSGFIISKDGYILTNAHVVKGANEVLVTLSDKREFKAKIVGVDDRSDVAVIKIVAKDLPAVKIGDMSQLKVGQWVIAIGSPFGLQNTVTSGIVSATQRDTGQYLPFIQTDVPINPGNSGGPLINMKGQVVGINSMIYSNSGGSMGISFSIPIDEAIRISDQLRERGYVTRGKIGVIVEPISDDVATALGLKKAEGAMVSKVEPDSPASKAGVKGGDLILKFNGKLVERSSDLPRMIGDGKPGSKGALTVFRDGKMIELSIILGEVDSDKVEAEKLKAQNEKKEGKTVKESIAFKNYGLKVQNLTAVDKDDLKSSSGVKVEVASGSSAVVGLQPGDVILRVGNDAVQSADQFDKLVGQWPKEKPLPILVQRNGMAQYVVLRAMLS